MGVVFDARDRSSAVMYGLKVLQPWRTSPEYLIRFKREFRAPARIDHPNCLRVFELACEYGQWFYAMEYARAGSLASARLSSWSEMASIGRRLLAALDHEYGKRIVHRDIKPQAIARVAFSWRPGRIERASALAEAGEAWGDL